MNLNNRIPPKPLTTRIQLALRGWHKEKYLAPKRPRKGDALEAYITRGPLGGAVLGGRIAACWAARFQQLLAVINATPSRARVELVQNDGLSTRAVKPKFVSICEEEELGDWAGESGLIKELLLVAVGRRRMVMEKNNDEGTAREDGVNQKLLVDSEAEAEITLQLLVWLQLREDHGCHVGVHAVLSTEGCPASALEASIARLQLSRSTERRLRYVIQGGKEVEFQSPLLRKSKHAAKIEALSTRAHAKAAEHTSTEPAQEEPLPPAKLKSYLKYPQFESIEHPRLKKRRRPLRGVDGGHDGSTLTGSWPFPITTDSLVDSWSSILPFVETTTEPLSFLQHFNNYDDGHDDDDHGHCHGHDYSYDNDTMLGLSALEDIFGANLSMEFLPPYVANM